VIPSTEPRRISRALSFARGTVADLSPLRVSPPFRRLWGGVLANSIGARMTTVVVAIQVYDISGSSLAVGLLGGVALIPLSVFGIYGGAIADAVDRRSLMIWTTAGSAICSAVLVAQAAFAIRSLPLLYLVVAAQSGLFAAVNPARQAALPALVGIDLLPAANALQQLASNLSQTVGPLLGGVLLAWRGFVPAYCADLATFVLVFYSVLRLPRLPPGGTAVHERAGFASILAGVRFLRTKRIVLMTFLLDLNATIFGMPQALFPAVAGQFYAGGAGTVGALAAAPAVGAIVGGVFSGSLGGVRRQGRAILVAITIWGAAITCFGFSRVLWLGLLLLAVAGAADMVSAVFRTSILMESTPDAFRGRLIGIYVVVVVAGPNLGDVESGAVASITSETISIISGGLLCLLGVLILAAIMPSFARYQPGQQPPAEGAVHSSEP
jgi:MFS family permease